MSKRKSDCKRAMTLNTEISDLLLQTESSSRTPRRQAESACMFPQSPRVSMQMMGEFQCKLRERELELGKVAKENKRLEFENEELLRLCCDKDKEIRRLNEENNGLKEKSSKDEYKDMTEYWRREVVKKNEEIRKLQDKVRYFQVESSYHIETEVGKLREVFEIEKEIVENKFKAYIEKEKQLVTLIKGLEKENYELKGEKNKVDTEYMGNHLKEIESLQNSLKEENQDLKQQLEIIRRGSNLHDLALLSPDIHQIAFQIHQLLIVLQNLRANREISISLILQTDDSSPISSSKQLIYDVASLKNDINLIKEAISDYYAENVGSSMCAVQ